MEPRRPDGQTELRKGGAGLGAGRRVLIAQSDMVLGDLYRDGLEVDGWRVEVCADGKSAWQRLVDSPPDVLLLNTLPDVPTLTFLERLRGHRATRHQAVIVLIDSVDNLDVRRAKDLGALAWLTKNRIMRERLSQTLADLLPSKGRSHQARDETAPARDQSPRGA